MPHTFPKRHLRALEVADPDVLTDVFMPIADKLAGRLNEHDISTEVKTNLASKVADEAYYSAHEVRWGINPDLTTANYWFKMDTTDVAEVSDSTTWQSIQERNDTGTMALTITCADQDTIVMFSQIQHAAWSGSNTDLASDINSPVKLQYAFRVDGAVQDDSITGAVIWPDPPAQGWYRTTLATAAAYEFDYRHIQYIQNTIGVNHAAGGTRLIYATKVQSGSHTFETVARRLPMSDYLVDNDGDGTTVQLFNRRFFILRIKGRSAHTGGVPSVAVEAFEDGQVVDAADINGSGFTALQTVINDLGVEAVERGAFRNEHLPSMVYGAKATGITPGSPTAAITGVYPGYNTNAAAWDIIDDGAGTNLRITGPTAGEWDLSANPGTFIVLANVRVAYVKWVAPLAPSNNSQALGCFALRFTNASGTTTLIGETEVYVNGHSFDNEATEDSADLDIDVPLMWVVDSADLGASDKHILRVEVVGSVWNGNTGVLPGVEMKTQQGFIMGFVLKGVSVA